MASHTLSDKGRIAFLTNVLLDFKGKEVTVNPGQDISLNANLQDYLVQQFFISELERIKQSYRVGRTITDQSLSSKIFLYIPSFNSIRINIRGIDTNFIDYLQNRLSHINELEKSERRID